MISLHVSAVCRVRDSYTGAPLEASQLLCALDGLPCRPVGKPGGCLVLVNLSPGDHRLSLLGHGYQEEWVDFHADSGTQELEITMKPGAGYSFRSEVTRLTLTVTEHGLPAADRQLWLAAPALHELKVAQAKAEAGATQFRLYCRGPESAVPPGAYLIADGTDSEIVFLQSLEGEMGTLAAPLLHDHSRSRLLLSAQRYHTDGEGRLSAVFQSACTLEVFTGQGGLLASFPLAVGENSQTLSL